MRNVTFLFLLLSTAPAQDPLAGLWLCDLGPRHAVLALHAQEHEPTPVRWGLRGGKTHDAVVRSGRGGFRSIRLEKLEPGRLYEVTCGWRKTAFETPRVDAAHVRIGVIGHTGGTHPRHRHPPEEAIARIRDLRTDLVVHGGDAVEFCTEQGFHRDFFRRLDPVMRHAPVHLAPGNHESGYPRAGVDYSVFKECIPYPLANAARAKDAPPFWTVRRGPVRLVFLTYYRNQLLPGTLQRKWLDTVLAERLTPFTFLVFGMGESTFLHGDKILKSLPEDRIDLVIGGDGEGARLEQIHGLDVLFCGSGGQEAQPYALVECGPHLATINLFDTSGRHIAHRDIDDRTTRPVRANLLPAFTKPSFLEGGKVHSDGDTVVLDVDALPFRSWVALPQDARGRAVTFDVSAIATTGSKGTQDVYVVLANQGHPQGAAYRSQPYPIDVSGTRRRFTVHVPDVDPLTGGAIPIDHVGLRIEWKAKGLKGIRLHAVELVE